ncbi:hypothetical protein KAW18_03075, partial [candidate division WOR-3 bacterium]|nr:hypothetical protein [candidate division WOR-3 bacterium]
NYKRMDIWKDQTHLLTLIGYTNAGVYLKVNGGDPEPITEERFDELVMTWEEAWHKDKSVVLKGNLIPKGETELLNRERVKFGELLSGGKVVL